ncbi:MAG: glycosyltransferase family 9 protein [Bacteroidota bacterium]
MERILIIQTAFIGDVVLATPLVEKLHHIFPSAKIDFLLRKGNETLLENHPFINEVIIWNKKENKTRNLFRIRKQLKSKKYDLIVNTHRFASSGFLTAFSGAEKTSGFSKNPFSLFFSRKVKHIIGKADHPVHEIDRNLTLIDFIGNKERFLPRLYPGKNDFEKVQEFKTQEYICIAPASVWFTKQYPAEKWIELIKAFDKKYKIILVGSDNDKILCDEIIKDSGLPEALNLAGDLSLLQTAALMRDAVMNYVNDSAPLHIASAMNAPVTAVFCSTVPDFGFGPLSEKSYIAETGQQMECRPCGLHGFKACPENHFECAYSIDNKKLIASAEEN